MKSAVAILAAAVACAALPVRAAAQDASGEFSDGANDAKVHVASHFVCPRIVGHFERDAVGEADPETSADFCSYSARDGVYATITLKPAGTGYDAAQSLASDFAVQENTGGKKVAEAVLKYPAKSGPPLSVYTRSYETTALEELHYRVLYSGAAIGAWAVEVTLEFADPRDNADERDFLDAVYRAALAEMPAAPAPEASAAPPLAAGPHPR